MLGRNIYEMIWMTLYVRRKAQAPWCVFWKANHAAVHAWVDKDDTDTATSRVTRDMAERGFEVLDVGIEAGMISRSCTIRKRPPAKGQAFLEIMATCDIAYEPVETTYTNEPLAYSFAMYACSNNYRVWKSWLLQHTA